MVARKVALALLLTATALGCSPQDQPTIHVNDAGRSGKPAATIHCDEHCRLIRDSDRHVVAYTVNRQGCFIGCLTDVVVPPGRYTVEVIECVYQRFGERRIRLVYDLWLSPGQEYWFRYDGLERGVNYRCYKGLSVTDDAGRALNVPRAHLL